MAELPYLSLPEKCGVYLFKDKKDQVVYIGKALNLKSRVRSYFAPSAHLGPKTASLISKVDKVETICVESEIEAYLLESRLIKKYQPKYNVDLKDGKAYPQIKISNEKIPRISLVRRREDKDAFYFGPFPDTQAASFVLKMARRMFPYRTCRILPVRPCLYFHLHLCLAPCTGVCNLKEYRENIDNLVMFLSGKKKEVVKKLTKKMNQAAKNWDFEKAQKIKEQIKKIEYITQPVIAPSEYLGKPGLLEDRRGEELVELRRILNSKFQIPNSKFQRIEAFDISNISGKEATGSMVVFVNGEPEKSSYRRFKIRVKGKTDDITMMEEVLRRRFKHRQWSRPDLIVVDGGIGQLGVAAKVLEEAHLTIPAIGLAKRWEEIYIKTESKQRRTDEGKIKLPRNSPALHLVQRIRDEAHRFAISYHRKLRRKTILTPKV